MTLLDTQLAVFVISDNQLAQHLAATSQGFYTEHQLLGDPAKNNTEQKTPQNPQSNKTVIHRIHTSNKQCMESQDRFSGK